MKMPRTWSEFQLKSNILEYTFGKTNENINSNFLLCLKMILASSEIIQAHKSINLINRDKLLMQKQGK